MFRYRYFVCRFISAAEIMFCPHILPPPLHKIESTKNEGETDLYDYGLSTLTQYQLTVRTTARIRGALLCRTDRGDYIIREFKDLREN